MPAGILPGPENRVFGPNSAHHIFIGWIGKPPS